MSFQPSPSSVSPAPSRPAKPERLSLLIGAFLVLLILAPSALFCYGRDQSVFAYMGSVIARGGMPYRDAWDLKPPGIYLAYGLLAAVVREDPWRMIFAVRLVDLLLAALTGALLVRLARRLRCPEAGWGAAAWYAAMYLQGGARPSELVSAWGMAQAETWANPLVLAAVLLVLAPSPPAWTWFGVGLALGAAGLLKFTAVLPALPALALALWPQRKSWAASLLPLAVGAALPFAAALAWLAAGRALDDYLDIQSAFVAPYTRLNAPGIPARLASLFGYTLPWLLRLQLPVLLAVLGWLATKHRNPVPGGEDGASRLVAGPAPRTFLVPALALLAALVSVWMQNKYFGYHWETALPWLALLAGLGTFAVMSRLRLRPAWVPGTAALLALGWSLVINQVVYRNAAAHFSGRMDREQWLAQFGAPGHGDFSFLADVRAAEYVRAHTREGDPILVWGFEPSVYLLSGRFPPTRFFFNVPVGVHFAPDHWRREFLEDLRRHPPELFLVLRNDAIPWASGRADDSTAQLRTWPELSAWLHAHYRQETTLEDFTFYRLMGRDGGRE